MESTTFIEETLVIGTDDGDITIRYPSLMREESKKTFRAYLPILERMIENRPEPKAE